MLLRVEIEPIDDDPDLAERLRIGLAAELRGVPGLDRIEPARGSTSPNGSKSGSEFVGGLVISGALSTATLTAVTKITLAWLARVKARTVVLERNGERLELNAASSARQREAMEAWLRAADQPGD